tara:strand:- start:601 stop:1056 length:456 start_codon:yes stop_codon:yes gene_type:complete
MAIAQAMCSSFKKELLEGKHNFIPHASGGNEFRMALYTQTSDTSLSATTTAYITANEVSSSGTNYAAKGNEIVAVAPSIYSGTAIAITDFANTTWADATFTARGALIFNEDTSGDTAVCVLDFGGDKTATSGTFTVAFPTPNSTAAIIRIA